MCLLKLSMKRINHFIRRTMKQMKKKVTPKYQKKNIHLAAFVFDNTKGEVRVFSRNLKRIKGGKY